MGGAAPGLSRRVVLAYAEDAEPRGVGGGKAVHTLGEAVGRAAGRAAGVIPPGGEAVDAELDGYFAASIDFMMTASAAARSAQPVTLTHLPGSRSL